MENLRAIRFLLVAFALLSATAWGQGNSAGLYGTANFGSQLVKIDLTTQTVSLVGTTGQSSGYSLAFSPAGTAYTLVNLFTAPAELATLDLDSGASTLLPDGRDLSSWLGHTQNLNIMGMVFTPDGKLLAGAMPPPSPTTMYQLDAATGEPSVLGWSSTTGELMSFAYDPTTGVLYGASPTKLYVVDQQTGIAAYLSTLSVGSVMGLAIGDDGAMYAADFTSSSKIYSVDRATGVATLLFDTHLPRIHNIAFNPGGPAEQLVTFASRIGALGISDGVANSLRAKLAAALDKVNRGQGAVACNILNAFANQAAALAGDQIPQAAGAEFAFRMMRLRTALACE